MRKAICFTIFLIMLASSDVNLLTASAENLQTTGNLSANFQRKLIEKKSQSSFLVQDFYNSGKKKTEPYILKNTKQLPGNKLDFHYNLMVKDIDGHLVSWYENGQKEYDIEITNGQPDGLWLSWFADGKKQLAARYQQGHIIALTAW